MNSEIGPFANEITKTIEAANDSLENLWSLIADTSKILGSESITNYAITRTISYNPQNAIAASVLPNIQNGTQILCDLISSCLLELQENPNNASKWIIAGKCYLQLSDFTNAYSAFTHVLRITQNVNDVYFWYAIGCVYQHFKFNDKALEFFLKVGDFQPGTLLYLDYHLRLGLLYSYIEKPQEALREFSLIEKTPPPGLLEDDIVFQKIFVYLHSEVNENALRDVKKLVDKYPNNLKILQQYIWGLSFGNSASMAEAKALIDKHPEHADDPLFKLVLAKIALESKEMNVAYQTYSECLYDWPECPHYWCGLGTLYFNNNQLTDACVAFKKVLMLQKEIAEAWLNFGLILEKNEDPENALKIYKVGMINCPTNQKLAERCKRLSGQGGRGVVPAIEEIKDSKYFVQVGDEHAFSIIRYPPPIPFNDILRNEIAVKAVEELRVPYESLFFEK